MGSRKVKKKVRNCWIEEDLSECIHERQSTAGSYVRGSAKKDGISESTIRQHLSKWKSGDSLKKPWWTCVWSKESGKIMLICIGVFSFPFLIL